MEETKYRYNGKELNEDFGLNWHDYGARWYAAAIGRWNAVDPLADEPEQIDKSVYAYAWNNPVILNDPDGRCPRCLKALGKTIVKSIAKGKLDLGEVYDIVDNGATLLSPSSTLLERGEALFNLASPFSTKELKAAKNFVEGAGDVNSTAKAVDNISEAKDDIHRIGGSSVDNLKLKPAEEKLNPPGISVLKADSPGEAAQQMRDAFPKATRLHEASKTIGSSNTEKIRNAGFDVMPDPTKKFPNHHRVIHPDGALGFKNEENLKRLSNAFKDSKGN